MRHWDAPRVAHAAGAELLSAPSGMHGSGETDGGSGPRGVSIDSRSLAPGELFVGLSGERDEGGSYAAQALGAGAWGVLVDSAHAHSVAAAAHGGAVLAHDDPLHALQALALAWRRELGARGTRVIAITGSTGKTSTKDILAGLLGASMRVAATRANLNTEIGLPLTLLGAPADSEVVVVEMAMRGPGQIAELTAIAEPDVGVIVNVGPAHLELLGSLEAVAAAKAELIEGLPSGASLVVPAREPLLERHLRARLDRHTITFGEGGDVRLLERRADGSVLIDHTGERIELWPSFAQAHNLRNLLAAVAAARALGHTPHGRLEVRFSAMRGQCEELPGGAVLIDDCYNANPMSMRAAIDELAETAAGRRVAVLGDMLELGVEAERLHREIGAHAQAAGVELLVTVGPLAAQMSAEFSRESHGTADAPAAAALLEGLVRDGDTVLVKGSRGMGLEEVSERLRDCSTRAGEPGRDGPAPAGGTGQALPGDTRAAAGAGPGRR